ILGTVDHIKSFTKEKLVDYINSAYDPNNIVVSIAGNVDHTFIPTVEKYFDHFNGNTYNRTIDQPTFLRKELSKKKDIEQAHLCIGYNGLSIDNDYMASLLVLNNALGGSMSSRLFQ